MKRPRDDTAKLAKALWSIESLALPSQVLQSRFDEIYLSAQGPATLWHLGGAANDYLRANPGSIHVPEELIESLLDSQIVDGRVIGLKLVNRCSTNVELICTSICRALESTHEGEFYGGLFELTTFLERARTGNVFSVAGIQARLSPLRLSSDVYVRERAERLMYELDESNFA